MCDRSRRIHPARTAILLIGRHHPGKLVGVAEELRREAEAKASDINAAYDRIKTLRKPR